MKVKAGKLQIVCFYFNEVQVDSVPVMDMDADASNFADDLTKYLTKALLNFAIGDMLDEDLKIWYNSWADKMNKQGGKLTPEQIQQYQKEYQEFAQRGIDKRNEIAQITGYTGKNDSSQQSSKGVFQGMSQDTGDALEGRFNAMQISGISIDNTLKDIQVTNTESLQQFKNFSIHFQEMRNIGIQSMYYLADIAKFTKVLPDMLGIMEQVKNNTARL
jgi:hypothetical protein